MRIYKQMCRSRHIFCNTIVSRRGRILFSPVLIGFVINSEGGGGGGAATYKDVVERGF